MLYKLLICLALVTVINAETCLTIIGVCVGGQCSAGQSCISDVCCTTDAPALTTAAPTTAAGGAGAGAQPTCDTIIDSCVMGMCPGAGQTCISGVCCLTAAATTTTVQQTTVALTTTPMPTTTVTTATPCFDKVGTSGVSDCPRLAYLCNDKNYYNLMTEQCPKTCGRCSAVQQAGFTTPMGTTVMATTASPCYDKAGTNGVSDCPRLAYLCNDKNYYDLMTEQCPKTCGRCSSASAPAASPTALPPSNSCVDKVKADGTSDCPKDAYLCNNAAYYDLMTQQCPKTCGRC